MIAMRDQLDKMTEIVKENLGRAQTKQKHWYDKAARLRQFKPGDQVLVLLPTETNKLLAGWQGPYQVVKRTGKVNYQIGMHDRRKRKRTFHVNMLREWHTPKNEAYFAQEVTDMNFEEVPVWNGSGLTPRVKPTLGKQLSSVQRAELEHLLKHFSADVIQDTPGRTTLIEHSIKTGDAQAVRLPPYRLPYAYRDTVKKEIQDMLDQGLIEHSSSDWSAPIVLVKKKDGSIRLCVDYRRLNGVSTADAYPMPRIDELIDRLGKSHYITTIDLTRGYWQVTVTEQDRHKTAFATPFGLY